MMIELTVFAATLLLLIVVAMRIIVAKDIKIKQLIKQMNSEMDLRQRADMQLLDRQLQLECTVFRQSESGQYIQRMLEQPGKYDKAFNAEQHYRLLKDIHAAFADWISKIRQTCPLLNKEDMLYCCLSKLKLSTSIIGLCMGSVNTNPGKQRKLRIKKKIEKQDCLELLEVIFGKE